MNQDKFRKSHNYYEYSMSDHAYMPRCNSIKISSLPLSRYLLNEVNGNRYLPKGNNWRHAFYYYCCDCICTKFLILSSLKSFWENLNVCDGKTYSIIVHLTTCWYCTPWEKYKLRIYEGLEILKSILVYCVPLRKNFHLKGFHYYIILRLLNSSI